MPALRRGGYSCEKQVNIGMRFGGGRHFVDVIATAGDGRRFLVSLKWQQVSGTAEQKAPFEAMCLAEAVRTSEGQYASAYLVLGGMGWKLREFFTGGGLEAHLRHSGLVRIINLEEFVAMANRSRL